MGKQPGQVPSIQGRQQAPTQLAQAAEQSLSSKVHLTLCSCSPSALPVFSTDLWTLLQLKKEKKRKKTV